MKEYKVLEIKSKNAEAKMNEMASQGWEVAFTNLHTDTGFTSGNSVLLITFVREKS